MAFVPILRVRGLGKVEPRQSGGIGPHSLAPQVADPQLETVSVRGLEGRIVGAKPDKPSLVVDADEESAATGVHEGGDGFGDNGLHCVVAFAGTHVPAGARLEFEGVGFAVLGNLGDGVEAGARVQVGGDQGNNDDDDEGNQRGDADHPRFPQVTGVEDPTGDHQATPQAG